MSYFGREGGLGDERRAIIDINNFIDIKEKAMKAHASQEKDWRMIIERSAVIQKRKKKYAHHEYFQLARTSLSDLKFPEDDLLAGIY
jgi:LmbE family N-acetylglucosaminyl deacetylase